MLPKLELEDSRGLECEITEDEVSVTLKNTKNNVAPGLGGFGGGGIYPSFLETLKMDRNGCN